MDVFDFNSMSDALSDSYVLDSHDIRLIITEYFFNKNFYEFDMFLTTYIKNKYNKNITQIELIVAYKIYNSLLKYCDIIEEYIISLIYKHGHNPRTIDITDILESFQLEYDIKIYKTEYWYPIVRQILNEIVL
jgi:hypothetical protein